MGVLSRLLAWHCLCIVLEPFDMRQREDEAMKTWDERVDRILGYVGLFIIGVLGWTADHFGDRRAASRPRPTPAMQKVDA